MKKKLKTIEFTKLPLYSEISLDKLMSNFDEIKKNILKGHPNATNIRFISYNDDDGPISVIYFDEMESDDDVIAREAEAVRINERDKRTSGRLARIREKRRQEKLQEELNNE